MEVEIIDKFRHNDLAHDEAVLPTPGSFDDIAWEGALVCSCEPSSWRI